MRVLGIETSCDDTGIAIYDTVTGLLANEIYSQGALHANYGGVVPELASREHIHRVIPLLQSILKKNSIPQKSIDAVAYTAGPGLAGALLVGSTVGHALAFAWQKPAIPIHHLEGHLLAPMIDHPTLSPPFLSLLVSGGNTQLIHVLSVGEYIIVGETMDDAAGEAFDKVAKILGLPYPGGALLSELAKKGDPNQFIFPRPMIHHPTLDFSFSGLKTAVANTVRKLSNMNDQTRANIAASFEQTVISILTIKCERALNATGLTQLTVTGGVSANHVLRQSLATLMKKRAGKFFCAQLEFCTDNGAMIAFAGAQRLPFFNEASLAISINPRWSLTALPALF